MFASLCLLVAVCVCLGESTLLKIVRDTTGAGGFQFGINGGGWGSGVAGTTAGTGNLGGHLAFGYTGTGLKIPLVPIVGADQRGQPEQGTNHQQGQGSYPQHGYGFILGGHGGYSLQGQGGFPIHFGLPHYGQGHPITPEGNVPQAGNGQPALPHQGTYSPNGNLGPARQPNYVPQVPQAGYPNQGGYIPQNQQPGYVNPGGLVPQNPETGYPISQIPQAGPLPNQGIYPGQGGNVQPGQFPDEPLPIDPRRKSDKTPEGPTSQGRRRTLNPEPETTENPDAIESPTVVDEEVEANTIPEDNE